MEYIPLKYTNKLGLKSKQHLQGKSLVGYVKSITIFLNNNYIKVVEGLGTLLFPFLDDQLISLDDQQKTQFFVT